MSIDLDRYKRARDSGKIKIDKNEGEEVVTVRLPKYDDTTGDRKDDNRETTTVAALEDWRNGFLTKANRIQQIIDDVNAAQAKRKQ